MKLAIPTILVSIVMVAGIFAFMPTYEASSVHTTIQNSQLELRTVSTNSLTYTAAQDLKITGAAATDIFTLKGLTFSDGDTGTNATAADDFDVEDIQVDGGRLFTVV